MEWDRLDLDEGHAYTHIHTHTHTHMQAHIFRIPGRQAYGVGLEGHTYTHIHTHTHACRHISFVYRDDKHMEWDRLDLEGHTNSPTRNGEPGFAPRSFAHKIKREKREKEPLTKEQVYMYVCMHACMYVCIQI
jgi:hypothetical protein